MHNKTIKKPIMNSFFKTMGGFSLVEMLMALLVASLLMAALAPVMTKKVSDNVNIRGVGDIYKAPADMQCYSYSDSNPSIDVSINDVYSASFIIASAGGGGAGATSTNKVAQTPVQITGTATADTTQEISITEYMTDVKVTLVGAGGGGAGGAGYVSECPTGTYEFNGNSGVKAFCITQFNVGEHVNRIQQREQAYIPRCPKCAYYASSDASASWTEKCGGTHKGICCWYAVNNDSLTANPEQCSSAAGYNACARTVCQYKAAESGCDDFKYVPSGVQAASWSLPSSEQVTYLKNTYNSNVSILGGKGVFLCSNDYLSGTDLCNMTSQHCWGSSYSDYSNLCYPNGLWVSGQKMIWMLNNSALGAKGLYGPFSSQGVEAYSARCTLEKSNLFKSYSGTGGGSGAYISELDITEYIKTAGVGGKIILTAGKSGAGGSKASSNNTKASDGSSGNLSKVIIQKENGDVVYGIRAKGGGGGVAAGDITTTGSAAVNSSVSTSRSCEYTTDGINWNETSCTKNMVKGGDGEAKWKEKAAAGSGSNSPVTSNTSGNGAGGEGGSSVYGYSNKIDATDGVSGKSGLVKITYKNEYAAAPGGGGGGGTIAQIKDVQLGRQAECTLTMGKGGKGGNIDNDGLDGGASSVKCNTDTRTFTVPGGKGGKKGNYATSNIGSGAIPIIGKGGDYGNIQNGSNGAVRDYNSSKKVIREGEGGEDGVYNQTSKISIGGRGGKSGAGTFGGCGGLYIEDDDKKGVCKVSNTDLKRAEGKGFKYEETITPNANELSTSFGISGAGGGGGGWEREIGSAKGGDGMNGYVCVYWYNTD